jgi:hypothetical protein
MTKSILLSTAAVALVSGMALAQAPAPTPTPRDPAAQTAPAPAARPAARPADQTVTIGENEFTSGNLVGMRVYAPKPASAAADTAAPRTTGTTAPAPRSDAAPAPASRTDAATAPAPRADAVPAMRGGRPAAVTDEQWRAMRERYDNIGEVNDLVMSADGRIHHVVLGVGGFLGIGEKNVSIEWSDLRLMRGSDGKLFAVVTKTKDQLQAMPTFSTERN